MSRARTQAGFIAGAEVFALGILVFVLATLIAVNAWAVVDAKMALTDAVKEGVRTYVEETPDPSAEPDARQAARKALEGHGRSASSLKLRRVNEEQGNARCAPVTFEAAVDVPLIAIPLLPRHRAQFHVTARHSELVDPLRTGIEGEAPCV